VAEAGSAVGRSHPLALTDPVEEEVLRSLAGGLRGFTNRPAQAANMTAFMAAISICPFGSFTITDVQRAVPTPRAASTKQLRYLLDEGGWDVEGLRIELIGQAIAAGVKAIFLECTEIRPKEAPAYDIVSISLLGDDFSQPVAWRRVWVPTEGQADELQVEQFERNAAAGLLAELCDDLETLGLTPDFAPLLALDWRYGEVDGLRSDIANLGYEYALEVGPLFDAAGEGRRPEDPVDVGPQLTERVPFSSRKATPDPLPIVTPMGIAPAGEVVVPFRREKPTYALARPRLDLRPGQPVGHRALNAARHLGELIGGVRIPYAAQCLRLTEFRYRDERGWRSAATLMGTLYAAVQGLFPKEAS
jgi:hypothetical protein